MELVVALISLVLLGGSLLCLAFVALATAVGKTVRALVATAERSGRLRRRPPGAHNQGLTRSTT